MEKVKSGSKKVGRNKDKCAKYSLGQRRIKNKLRKLKKQFKKFGEPDIANRIKKLEGIVL